MATVTEQDVRAALQSIDHPGKGTSIVDLGMISGLVVKDGNVGFAIEVDPAEGAALEPMRKAAEEMVMAMPGVVSVTAVLTAHNSTPGGQTAPQPQEPAPQPQQQPAGARQAAPGHGDSQALAPTVRHIVAVASGKGGVGKSTTAVNFALALAAEGAKVGLLDADVYGPSLPRMMGISGKPTTADGKRLDPMENYGVKVMSMGFLVDEETPMIWRGPMVMSAIQQMLRDVVWGDLDVLVVDMPPGTGDAQLTLAQQVPLAGAVIVSTPQDIALLDARKGLNMFRKVDVPVLGIVENMSYYQCPKCGDRAEIFGHGGARNEAERLGVDFLGEIPLDIKIRETSDGGNPVVASEPDGPHAQAYRALASRVLEKLDGGAERRAGPRIVVQ